MTETCVECGRIFDMLDPVDEQERFYGHDCESDTEPGGRNEPKCDICGQPEDHTDGVEYDWNGETGNHLSCEERDGPEYRLADDPVLTNMGVEYDNSEEAWYDAG